MPFFQFVKLKDVAKYIDENHHLPGVPSAAEIEADGLNLGDMQNIQMQKIEELTLYMIEMEKRIEALEMENEELKKLNIKQYDHEKERPIILCFCSFQSPKSANLL